jgi:hypothetical protein
MSAFEPVFASKEFGISLFLYRSPDNTPIIEVVTSALEENEAGPICRLYMNDHCYFENPPFLIREWEEEKKTEEK